MNPSLLRGWFSGPAALALALFASWVASRPSGRRWTYGRVRAEILAALAQGVALILVAVPCFYLVADDLRQRVSGWVGVARSESRG